MYPNVGNCPQLVDDLKKEIRPQAVDELESIFCIPWGHNRCILDEFKGSMPTIEEIEAELNEDLK